PRADGLQAILREPRPRLLVRRQPPDLLPHLRGALHAEVVASRAEEALQVAPGSRQQRDAARQRLERPDGGDSRQPVQVWPARDVHRHPRAGESLGDAVVRDPSAELDAGLPDLAQPVLRVTNPVDGEAELTKGAGGIDQILADVPRSLVV